MCLSLDVVFNPGECWVILGRNGTGKTTLLHTLAGLRATDNGSILLDGTAIEQLPRRRIAQHMELSPQDTTIRFLPLSWKPHCSAVTRICHRGRGSPPKIAP